MSRKNTRVAEVQPVRQKKIGAEPPTPEPKSQPSAPPSGPVLRKPDLAVPWELSQGILQYLGTKPYVEVHQFIAGIVRCAQTAEARQGEMTNG